MWKRFETHPVKFFNCLFKKKPECDQWKTALWTFFEHLILYSVDQWVIFERYIVWWFFDWEKRYYIFYIAYCGVLIAHWEILLDFFFSLLNDKFDKKKTHWTVKTCEKMQNFRIIAVKSSWWIETGDYFECKWSSMIIEWKKVDLKVSNLRWDTL